MSTQRSPLRVRVKPAGRQVDPPPPVSTARERVRQALTCPYCRDEVGQRDAWACRRAGCGAVYHRDCWDECLTDYGACAVFGCACREAEPLSRAGLLWRFLRLLVAAALFPPRLIETLRQDGTPQRQALWRRIHHEARLIHHETWSEKPRSQATATRHGITSLIQLVLGLGLLGLLGWATVSAIDAAGVHLRRSAFAVAVVLGGVIAAAGFGTYGLMGLSTLGLVAAKSVLLGEFAALGRADRGESVLARMRRGGKKG